MAISDTGRPFRQGKLGLGLSALTWLLCDSLNLKRSESFSILSGHQGWRSRELSIPNTMVRRSLKPKWLSSVHSAYGALPIANDMQIKSTHSGHWAACFPASCNKTPCNLKTVFGPPFPFRTAADNQAPKFGF
ncbi:hypothetical protein P175DRAFT_0530064 [Aspergillus ochraceoroseus IBT 24754]|uniref:Uncharacterized protein n=1 Tax=Aspergillus ochraceoroseus IBT 24754 TaxID=1392256 RepID=A0A2T5M369_9EURO|nr:uncharacterized protein P175DRAFT_0530064 [Aspergillus ochraceoroseus IBT 24754]PTU22977.1 hypothetical protein P175DRAFT_0530064 [Aspergillus ochraceoroseus IBT 24754]